MSDRWSLHHGDCLPWLAAMPDKSVDVCLTDPPYSEHVHGKSRAGSRELRQGRWDKSKAAISRSADLGFPAITPEEMAETSRHLARVTRRWVLVFSDMESTADWRRCLVAAGLDYVRTGVWVKLGATPQFTGDRPAPGFEAITIAHPKGKKRWNGGGTNAVWTHAIELNRGGGNERLHTTQKPLPLLLELVSLFSDPGETILDPYAGSGTTGVAALRLGRRFLGAEKDVAYAQTASERLTAEEQGQSLHAARAGQMSLLGGAR
jgi:site-specific DNA-methyltransferase (adenine-specific)